MLILFFLFETYKEDVLKEVIPIGSYATTVRRKALDFAAKVIDTGGEIILKVTKAVMNNYKEILEKIYLYKCYRKTPDFYRCTIPITKWF